MGCLLSCYKKSDVNHEILIKTPSCFVCGKTFNDLQEYNDHIIHCNKIYKGRFRDVLR